MVLYISYQTYDRFSYNYYVSTHLVDETSIQLSGKLRDINPAMRHPSSYRTSYDIYPY
jgi:hypothetical protein